MVNHKHKFIFVHIPRTGGTSIECFFDKQVCENYFFRKKHSSHRYELAAFSDYFSFTFVRNPWDRMLSFYLKVTSGAKNPITFLNWLKSYHVYNKYPCSMCDFIFDTNETQTVDFVGRYENFQDDFNFVCNKLDVSVSRLQKLNQVPHEEYTNYYDTESIALVNQLCYRDIEFFEYEYGK